MPSRMILLDVLSSNSFVAVASGERTAGNPQLSTSASPVYPIAGLHPSLFAFALKRQGEME
jgi:hypothetical protein